LVLWSVGLEEGVEKEDGVEDAGKDASCIGGKVSVIHDASCIGA
jgi:hypothetical protein